MKTLSLLRFIISPLMLRVARPAFAQGTTFTYHGRLKDNGSDDPTFPGFVVNPPTGNQFFRLHKP